MIPVETLRALAKRGDRIPDDDELDERGRIIGAEAFNRRTEEMKRRKEGPFALLEEPGRDK